MSSLGHIPDHPNKNPGSAIADKVHSRYSYACLWVKKGLVRGPLRLACLFARILKFLFGKINSPDVVPWCKFQMLVSHQAF